MECYGLVFALRTDHILRTTRTHNSDDFHSLNNVFICRRGCEKNSIDRTGGALCLMVGREKSGALVMGFSAVGGIAQLDVHLIAVNIERTWLRFLFQ